MTSDRRLWSCLLVLGAIAHAGALAAPWVRAWTPDMQLESHSGADVLGQALAGGTPWGVLALGHLLSALTLVLAWRVPRARWARRGALLLLVAPTLLLALPLAGAGLWNGANAWPEGWPQSLIHALAPGQWWVEGGVLLWGLAQALHASVLVLRTRTGHQAELQRAWAARVGASASMTPPVLSAVAPSLRPLVLEAHRLRVDLDAPVRPLDPGCRAQLLELAASMQQLAPAEREALRRAGIDPAELGAMLLSSPPRAEGAKSWLAELHAVDRSLHQLVQAATRPTQVAYR
ncbi:MAG: hypothetical protein KDK70_09165 [Myxococcales bacterium]|nr:hypothetical protein [Myxococcales bacterium]